jgi:hypothetical protein
MCSKGFIRRMLPFFATFAVGLFIASFFVSVGAPRFRGRGWERHQMNERLRIENEELRNENLRLRNELESHDWTPSDIPNVSTEKLTNRGPEFPVVDAPVVPVAPRAPRHNR